MKKYFQQALSLGLIFISCLAFAEQRTAQLKVSEAQDTLSLELSGFNQWDYEVQKDEENNKARLKLVLPTLSRDSQQILKTLKSPFVQKIEVDPNGPDQKTIVKILFKSNQMEAFDYLTDQPSRLIIDLFENKKIVKKKSTDNDKEDENAATSEKNEKLAKAKEPKKSKERAPASEVLIVNPLGSVSVAKTEKISEQKGIFDGGDPDFKRFTIADYEIKDSSLIAAKENVYIDVPMLRTPLMKISEFEESAPIYRILPKDSQENKEARLLQVLFEKKRHNVFLKTVEWFNKKYPDSEYKEIIDFMTADTYFSVWQEDGDIKSFDQSMTAYARALNDYPKSILAERTRIFMGFANMDRGDYVSTLRSFKKHLLNNPNSPRRDLSRFAIAEAFLNINKYDDSLETYNEIINDPHEKKSAIKAEFLKGDVYYQSKNYQQAAETYDQAIKRFPSDIDKYPSAVFNQASALFWLNKYKESLVGQVDFLKRFPNHDYAAYAMTRAGEIMDIFGADKQKVLGAYLETFFRYGESPSAYIARIRIATSRMKDMKPKELEKSVADMKKMAAASKLTGIEPFTNVLISDGYRARKEYDKAIDMLVKYYQVNPTTVDANLFTQRIIKNINDKIRDQVDSGNFIQGLKTHQKYADTWLRGSDRIDTQFFLAKAYEDSGVQYQSERLLKDTLNRLLALQNTEELKKRSVLEYLPTIDTVRLRLAQVSFVEKKYSQAFEELKEMKAPEKLTEVQQIERIQLIARLLDQRGDPKSATRYLVDLIKAWKGNTALVAEPYFSLGLMELKQNKKAEAIKSFSQVDQLMVDSNDVNPITHAKALEQKGMAQLELGQKSEALQTFNRLLELYETSRPMTVIRYRAGLIHFEKGEVQKAAEVWRSLESQQNGFWYRIAQEKLKNSEWKDDYRKYIERIPAMSN
jgi:tetratricopeptide (TPR) repeat protein